MKQNTRRKQDFHSDWLTQVDREGPFLALPVLKDIWPSGVDRLGDADDRLLTFKQAFVRWQRAVDQFVGQPRTPESVVAYSEVNRAWIETVLAQIAEWDDLRTDFDVSVQSPGEQITVSASGSLPGRNGTTAALLLVCEPTTEGLRATGLDGWAANDVDRLAMLLRKSGVEVGIVTDGQWWGLVWAKDGKTTASGMVNALTWGEEDLLRDAFFTLINQRRFRTPDAEQCLPRLFERSELEAETITEALGTQVRKSVELLVQAFSEERLKAARNGDSDPLTEKPDDVYQAAVTVMMRIVFLLFAEERDMLPTEQLYWESYAIKDLLSELRRRANDGEEHLDETYDAWHRLLAVSQALHSGVNYDEMRMPAYGGSLLNPERFPWLHAVDETGLRLRVSDRVMMHVLESVQTVVAGGERRRISFREIDVEQIGYIYEGLLGYSCSEVTDDIVLGLVGKDGEEPEIPMGVLKLLFEESADEPKNVAAALVSWAKENQPAATGKTVAALAKLIAKEPSADERAELVRLLTPVAGSDPELLGTLVGWGNLIRRDLRNIPLVFPIGGLVVVETPSRKNSGAHYTPRSLAEEVVLHALQPLTHEPGPLQTNDEKEWKLKSAAEILDLKVADIAAGSGAFLVAAARYLAECVVETWTRDGMLTDTDRADADEVKRRALREVIARCLYGADINPMAVEMSKLSLWLVSMDKTKPFSFVDDKIFCGNSLLGLTNLDQLRYLHLYPEPTRMHQHLFVDIDGKIDAATMLRRELASPVEEHDPMRSARAKHRLLEQVRQATDALRLVADGVVAAGLPLGGKRGRQLDDAFKTLSWQVHEEFRDGGQHGRQSVLAERAEAGLKPTVETDYERWVPIHWVVETPEVMVERGGFDALIGNPPFQGGQKITSSMGTDLRDWLVEVVASGRKGSADLVAYFLLRAVALLNRSGVIALIATNSVAQGVSREVGLDAVVREGLTITRAIQSREWPARSANLEFAAVWGTKQAVADEVERVSDGIKTARISTLLEPVGRVGGNPIRLLANRNIAFQGCIVRGRGFVISPEQAGQWIRSDRANAGVLFPYLGGEDVNKRPDHEPLRWIVDFYRMSEIEAATFVEPFMHVQETVKSERLSNKDVNVRKHPWWRFERERAAMRREIEALDEVLVIAQVSRTLMPARVSNRSIYDAKLVIFALADFFNQAVLSGSAHQLWSIKYGTTMRTDPTYVPTKVFETFPRPEMTDRLVDAGKNLEFGRSEIMRRRKLGLTALYNLVDDPDVRSDSDIDQVRDMHAEVDVATMEAYGWGDLRLNRGFHTYRQMERWTVSPVARVEILERLLELNYERARAEGQVVPNQRLSDREGTLFS